MNTTSVGRIGEDIACEYLRVNGYKIIKRNYRAAHGEVDIIAQRGMHLSFVEVKTRHNSDYGYASDAVNYKKQQRIKSAAKVFLMTYHEYDDMSFDVCEVYTSERTINYIESAFE
jgi:putative endonuclease